jgi:hypothetical protein
MNLIREHLSLGRIAILVIAVALVVSLLIAFNTQAKRKSKELVESELSLCVVAVCLRNTRIGEECELMSHPTLSKLLITVDQKDSSHRKIILVQTDTNCK